MEHQECQLFKWRIGSSARGYGEQMLTRKISSPGAKSLNWSGRPG